MLLMMTLLLSGCVSGKNDSQKMTTAERIVNKANLAPEDVINKKFYEYYERQKKIEREKLEQEKEDSRIVYELPPKTKFVSASWSEDKGITVVYKEVEKGENYKPTVYYVNTPVNYYKVVESEAAQ